MTLSVVSANAYPVPWRKFITFSVMDTEVKENLTLVLDQLASIPEGVALLEDIHTKLGKLTIHANENQICYFEHNFESTNGINQLNVGYGTIKNTAYRGTDDQLYYTSVNRAFIHELAHAADNWQSDYIQHQQGKLKPDFGKMTSEECKNFDLKMSEQLTEHENIAIRRSNLLMQKLYGEVPQKTFNECKQPVENLTSTQWEPLLYRNTGNVAISAQSKKMAMEHGLQTATEKFRANLNDSTHVPEIQAFKLHMGMFKPKPSTAVTTNHR